MTKTETFVMMFAAPEQVIEASGMSIKDFAWSNFANSFVEAAQRIHPTAEFQGECEVTVPEDVPAEFETLKSSNDMKVIRMAGAFTV